MELWYPKAKVNKAVKDAGEMGDFPYKLVIHTTESTSPFAPSSYQYGNFGHTYYPHFTLDRDGTFYQHMGINRAARALKGSSYCETNRAGAVQVECIGRSDSNPDAVLGTKQVEALQQLWLWLKKQVPLKDVALPAGKIPGSASESAPQRLSKSEWYKFNGICGHRHVPYNEHWDPGAFDLSRIIVPSPPLPPPPVTGDNFMIRKGDGPTQYIRGYQYALNRFFTDTGGQPSMGWLVKDGVAGDMTFAATWEALQRLKSADFSHSGAFDLTVNGLDSQATLEAAGIDPVLIAAIVGVSAIR